MSGSGQIDCLEVNNVACERNDIPLFAGADFRLNPGQALRIAGANGIGKTTLIKILCGFRRATLGSVHWQGQAIHKSETFHQDVRFLGHKLGLKSDLTVAENWSFSSALYAAKMSKHDLAALASKVGLHGCEKAYAGELSAGQQRRVALGRLHIGASKLWVLDEAFVSLDTEGRNLLTQWIVEHLNSKGSVLFTAHHEVDFPADVFDLEECRIDTTYLHEAHAS